MGELKCPACKTALSKPLPERCPVCKLEGLNRMFLTLEDYEDWKKNVLDEHIKKLRNHKIFVCDAQHVLVLMDDGTLFQIEGNKPAKVAENVKSVAAGYNYSLYLDSDGKVHFLGNSGIPFKERFKQGDLVFKKVFARLDIDIFGAEDTDGHFYVWGNNHSEVIQTHSLKVLFRAYRLEEKKIDDEYEDFVKIYGRGNIERNISYRTEGEEKKEFCWTMERNNLYYETSGPCLLPGYFEKCYIKFNGGKFILKCRDKCDYDKRHCPHCDAHIELYRVYREMLVTGEITYIDNYIFEPQSPKKAFDRLFGVFAVENRETKKFISIFRSEFEIYARLRKDSTFIIFRRDIDDSLIKIISVKSIMDCSELVGGFIYLIDYSNKIWSIKSENLRELKQEVAPEGLLKFICEL